MFSPFISRSSAISSSRAATRALSIGPAPLSPSGGTSDPSHAGVAGALVAADHPTCRGAGRAVRPAAQAAAEDVGKGLGHDGFAHLARAHLAVGEDDGHFFDAEALAHALVDRLDLESVAFQADGVEVERLQHAAPVALESCGAVTHGQLQERARKDVAKAADEPPGEPPVGRLAAGHI